MMEKICILIIAYNRPDKLFKTISQVIELVSDDLPLVVEIDGPKNKKDNNLINRNEEICKKFIHIDHFSYHRKKINVGLRQNVISSIERVFEKYEMIIVLEDDIIVSQAGILWAKLALNRYKNDKKIFHINLWTPPKTSSDSDFFTRYMNCWGWATWKDRWVNFDLEYEIYNKLSKKISDEFNLNGFSSNLEQIELNKIGEIKTWAVFWAKHIFRKKGLCLNPRYSYVKNIGFDRSASHTRYNKDMLSQNISHIQRHPDNVKIKVSKINEIKLLNYLKKQKKNSFQKYLIKVLSFLRLKNFIKKNFFL